MHISTGDLLRAEVAAGTEIGNKAKEYMNAGRLVPDEIVTAVLPKIACLGIPSYLIFNYQNASLSFVDGNRTIIA